MSLLEGTGGTAAPTLDEVVYAIQETLSDLRMQANEIRGLGITPKLLDGLLALRFRAMRLERRLESLRDGGLLSLTVRRVECPGSILARVISEVEGECERLGVSIKADLVRTVRPLPLDGHQLAEALRGILEDQLAAAERGGRVSASATARMDGGVEIRLSHDGPPAEPTLCSSGIAQLLACDPTSGIALARGPERGVVRLTVHRPPDLTAPVTARFWHFPAPAA